MHVIYVRNRHLRTYANSCVFIKSTQLTTFNPLKGRGLNWLHFAIQV